jgi:SAM-dependent MidA family methyltransferase
MPDSSLPPPSPDALAHSERLRAHIMAEIAAAGGLLPFDRYMELALYAPGLGYYAAGARKLGPEGDFVTAPEISPLFGRCMAAQCAEILGALGGGDLLEFGAGTGALAAEMIATLERLGAAWQEYLILEPSPDLRERQRVTLADRVPGSLCRVRWLDRLPDVFRGVMLGNEVLDAFPVHRFRIGSEGVEEGFVTAGPRGLVETWAPARSAGLEAAVRALESAHGTLPEGYCSEVSGRLAPWLRSVGAALQQGALLLVDYGYTAAEYYHPERSAGTLRCHYRHRVHADPLLWPGLQDITASVDFTAVARAEEATGLSLAGYATQAAFLLGTGIDRWLAESDPADVVAHQRLVQAARTLTLPGEMGERFKAIGLGRGLDLAWRGYSFRDLRSRL